MKDQTPAAEWLEDLRKLPRCNWCGDHKKLKTAGLCYSCEDVKRQLAKAEKNVSEMPSTTNKHQESLLRWERDVAEEKKEILLAKGMEIESILDGEDFSSHDLEKLFCRVSSAVCHKPELHYGIATRLGETFTLSQRQVLGYLLWKTFLVDDKRRLTFVAQRNASAARVRAAEAVLVTVAILEADRVYVSIWMFPL